jgi:hypothetical protein
MAFARCLRILLAVALFAAWQSALVHPLKHVDAAGEFVHLADGHDGKHGGGQVPDPLCDAIAALAASVAGPAGFAFFGPAGAFVPVDAGVRGQRSAPRLAYRSQAPPQSS